MELLSRRVRAAERGRLGGYCVRGRVSPVRVRQFRPSDPRAVLSAERDHPDRQVVDRRQRRAREVAEVHRHVAIAWDAPP
jgi:hypothetical protein